ncbi:hypothetical protein M0R89_16035 [Halorussus limi]|uniref:Uncharacterized protein n=1 Tax=Halorussus limi TaxID=2938695 RepID=A0A8U0HSI8_9EURY|nr:hypothetical protein [Halorussus limi]UPV74035.1 hypothetical protein M0R89_16035 [Halorussus limi]
MSKIQSEEDDELQEGNISENLYDKDLLIAEYTQTGEEFRYRDKLLHNSYYLLIIATFAIVGIVLREFRTGNVVTIGISILVGGLGFSLIGAIILNHFIQRQSAEALRTRTEQYAEGIQNEPVQRPLGIQYWVIGNNSNIVNQDIKKSDTFWQEMRKLPKKAYSAKTVAFCIFWSGLLITIGGLLILVTV